MKSEPAETRDLWPSATCSGGTRTGSGCFLTAVWNRTLNPLLGFGPVPQPFFFFCPGAKLQHKPKRTETKRTHLQLSTHPTTRTRSEPHGTEPNRLLAPLRVRLWVLITVRDSDPVVKQHQYRGQVCPERWLTGSDPLWPRPLSLSTRSTDKLFLFKANRTLV